MTDPQPFPFPVASGAVGDEMVSPEFLASLLADGDEEMASWVIGRALAAGGTRAEVYDALVQPAMAVVGQRWETGQWPISVEHLASVALAGALSRLRPDDRQQDRTGPLAVLVAPKGEQHVAALACLAQVLSDDGWRVENLGPNVPAEDLVRFLGGRDVDLVALTAATEAISAELQRTVTDLRRAFPALAIVVGGGVLERAEVKLDGASCLCHSLADAQAFARSLGRTGRAQG
jgi:methanogenic corrinoid protein MtbC1